ncbi:MAG: glycosyltransferase family 4 protein [Paludibacteraceae bacterium]|nr:glycosyltransferase family 4 protein [Paludibacteraceae bacterium]
MSTIYFDAKRAFLNKRGLGNYSRDAVRLMTTYAPDNEYILFSPKIDKVFPEDYPWVRKDDAKLVIPSGIWKTMPSLWRSYGCTRDILKTPGKAKNTIYWGLSGEVPIGIRKTGCKVVVTMHDAIFMRYPELYSATYRRLFARKVQYACDAADLIIAISEQTKRDLIEFFGADEKKTRVVYQGCSNIFREYAAKVGAVNCLPVEDKENVSRQASEVCTKYALPERYVLDVGAIEPRKNLLQLVRAMGEAKIELPLVAIGGRSSYADKCAQEAERSGVKLLLRHEVSFADFPALYAGAEVLCYPSVFEGFGIPILEAMCVGTPVLTSTGSCFKETGGEAALYANPTDTKEIGEQLRKILTDRGLRKRMRQKGYEQADKFRDEKVAANLIAAIKSIV